MYTHTHTHTVPVDTGTEQWPLETTSDHSVSIPVKKWSNINPPISLKMPLLTRSS